MLGLRKPNFKTKIIHFEISHNAEMRILKKMRIFNSLIVPKNLKEGTFCDFRTFALLQNIKTNLREDPLRTLKKFRKKVSQSRKKGGVS